MEELADVLRIILPALLARRALLVYVELGRVGSLKIEAVVCTEAEGRTGRTPALR